MKQTKWISECKQCTQTKMKYFLICVLQNMGKQKKTTFDFSGSKESKSKLNVVQNNFCSLLNFKGVYNDIIINRNS
eukprot:UN09657